MRTDIHTAEILSFTAAVAALLNKTNLIFKLSAAVAAPYIPFTLFTPNTDKLSRKGINNRYYTLATANFS